MTRMKMVVGAVLCVATGAGITWCGRPSPAPAGPSKVSTDTVFMERDRVPLTPSLGARLATAAVKPTQTRVADTPSSQGRKAVADYCAPSIVLQNHGRVAVADTGITKLHNPLILPDFGGRKSGPRLTLFSTLNDGRRWSADYHARGRITWLSSGDSVLVRGDRLWVRVLRGAPRCAAAAAVSGGVGALLDRDRPGRGLLLGSISTIAGCLL